MNDMTDPTGAAAPERVVRPLWEHAAEVGAPAAVSAAEALRRVATDEAVSRRPGSRSRPVTPAHDTPGTVAGAHDGTPASPAFLESGIPARSAAVVAVPRSVGQAAVPTSTDGENAYRPATAG
ncbi:hypothetical protein [Kitasatospora aureofaciens]|uniref:hypothetical protein n=1 Tax=Kitasatospora aureofaciens TaxID=1894 RepID=UPI001C4772D6|nr:hypothetical protein [Kitasatospora aureofaciens]MBV6702803.1 hypothetical protein [Kitasatospora aureofaciens]